MSAFWLIIVLGGVTYFTRISGHLMVSRFGVLHPRLQAALDAVPAAVITAIIIPPVIEGGLPERVAFVVAVLAGLRFSMVSTVVIGLVALVTLRAVTG